MAYDENLVSRIRHILAKEGTVGEKKMFGGVTFMLGSNMCCGVVKELLMVRVGPENYEQALAEPHVQPMTFTGRPFKGYLYVSPEGCRTEEALRKWVLMAARFTSTLPSKAKG